MKFLNYSWKMLFRNRYVESPLGAINSSPFKDLRKNLKKGMTNLFLISTFLYIIFSHIPASKNFPPFTKFQKVWKSHSTEFNTIMKILSTLISLQDRDVRMKKHFNILSNKLNKNLNKIYQNWILSAKKFFNKNQIIVNLNFSEGCRQIFRNLLYFICGCKLLWWKSRYPRPAWS